MKTVSEFRKSKSERKISVVTCYDYWSARIIDESGIDAVLVGDSLSMVIHGFETTVNADIELMVLHTSAVKRGVKNKLIIADLPFLAHRMGRDKLMENAGKLIKAGAQALKIEGGDGNTIDSIGYLVESGIPVMGHLGLTPQSVHQFGGFKLRGKEKKDADYIIESAVKLEAAGCFGIVLEMIPSEIAKIVTEKISIPTIGIGAGMYTDGQVLVLHDMLGFNKDFSPKFLRKYQDGYSLIKEALNNYSRDVKNGNFPNINESY
ncbi:3-methyl-2-oxobutanoate hydroxymethyltransferase [Melioribacter sp. OK-6-Me]|uniref:3-methyl-2-oxobutanoate hydroxymethyltransferase n=1 Tax=unclassified Melioribacter TaxID=2627329 RepID=UPI003ED9ABC7